MKLPQLKLFLPIIIVLLLYCHLLQGQNSYNFDEVKSRSFNHIKYLSSPKLMGRSSLTGHDLFAAFYIDSIFTSLGLNPVAAIPHKTNFQDFIIQKITPLERLLKVNQRSFEYGRDFVSMYTEPQIGKNFEVVFGGMGSVAEIEGLDLSGKALLVFTENLRVSGMKVLELADKKGCSLIISVNPANSKQFFYLSQQILGNRDPFEYTISQTELTPVTRFQWRYGDHIPQLIVNNDVAESILGENPKTLYQKIQKSTQNLFPTSSPSVTFDYRFQTDTIPTQNVVGWIPASRQTQQSIVLSAHFDHLQPEGRKWFPGADDNASGISALIEIARMLTVDVQNGYMPNKNIVFAAVSAEEIGLFGSQYYSLNPLFPVDSTTALLNFDMVGRLGNQGQKGKKLYIGGNNRIQDFHKLLLTVHDQSLFNIDAESQAGISVHSLSDHYHYDRLGRPSFLITTGIHDDYHKPTDKPQTLDYDGIADVVKLLYNAVKQLADKPNPFAN
jgi:hypothetical protein